MELKEARYILAIARHQSIGKAAESLYISQPSLSKYLKNMEERLGAPLFNRYENRYYPTYMGERYLHYAEQIVACGDEWMQEYDDIAHRQRGRLNIAVPIMMGSTMIEPLMAPFHKRYPYVTLNIMEAVNFIAENSMETSSIDLTLYNIHEFPESMDYQILRTEEIVLVLHENHPLAAKAIARPGFRYPWLDLSLLKDENFILLYPDQNTGGIAQDLFKEYNIDPPIFLHTRNSSMSIHLAMDGVGAAFAPESYFHHENQSTGNHALCFSVGHTPALTTTIAAYQKNRYLPQHARDFLEMIKDYCGNLTSGSDNI